MTRSRRRRCLIVQLAAPSMVLAALAGCSGQSGGGVTTAHDGAKQFRTGTPTKPVGNLRWYTFYRPVLGLMAAAYNDYPELMVNANLCESVVRVDPDYSIKPGLADFTANADSTQFTYTIRPGAKFWDGSPVTSQDVVFSIKANTGGPLGAQNAALGAEIKSITAVDATTVSVTLKAPDIIFNQQLAGSAGKVYEKKQALAAGQHWGDSTGKVMCSGPYKLGAWEPATSLQIVRNDDYWGPDFKPLVKSVTFSWPQDPTTLSNAFRAGTLDGGWNIPPSIGPTLQKSGAGQMYVGSTDTAVQLYGLIVSSTTRGPLADPRVRQAFSKTIDREAIASRIYRGAADPTASLLPPGSFAYDSKEFQQAAAKIPAKQDVAGAKQLIADTGRPAPTLTLALPASDALATATATAIQSEAAQAGFTIKLRPMAATDYSQLFGDPKTRVGVDLFFLVYAPMVRDPLVYFSDMIDAHGVYNFNGYDNPRIQQLLASARAATDTAARARDILSIQDQFQKDLPLVPLAAPRVTVWEGKKFTGAPTTFTYLQSPWAALIGGK